MMVFLINCVLTERVLCCFQLVHLHSNQRKVEELIMLSNLYGFSKLLLSVVLLSCVDDNAHSFPFFTHFPATIL